MIRLAMLAAAILLSSWTATAAIDTVRVDASSGAPRLLVDGKPVRARMFWGAPGSLPLPLQPAGQEMSFEFTPTEDEPNRATMHFRFGEVPGEIFFDDIRIADLTAGSDIVPVSDFESGPESFSTAWTFWPQGAQNTVGKIEVQRGVGRNGSAGLRIALAPPPNGRWPDFHVYHLPNLALKKAHRYRVSLWARANPARNLTIALYRPGESFVYLGGPPSPFESQIKLAAAVGVDFVSFPVNLPWPKPGAAVDWSTPLAQCRAVLAANPKALLLPRIGMDPPPWWLSAHPDDAMVWDSGTATRRPAVVASPDYRRDAAQRLAALVEHLEQELGPHIAGYHPCGQNTGEWFYQDTWLAPLNGYAAGDLRAWRIWLKSRYPDVAALRSAWHNPQVDFLTATIPAPAARLAAPAGALRDPQAERNLLDFAEFQQQAMAECVCDLAHSVRTASKGRKLVVFFYGYVFEFGAINNGPAVSGHYALRRVLNCPDVDVLCSPISYFDRALGQNGPSMTAAESIALAGKMWLYEDDTSTHLSSGMQPGSRERVTTIDQTNALLVRNTAQCALRNFGTWWMDLGATGWFNDPRMWAEMDRLKPLDESLLRTPRPFRPEVAAVLDEASMLRISAGARVLSVPATYEIRRPLGRMGCPYGQYLLDDVLQSRVRAKLFVLLNAWSLAPEQRRQLRAATRDSLRIWCYAPGYHDRDRLSLESMQELTGFRLQVVSPEAAWAEPTELGKKLGLKEAFGAKQPLGTYPSGTAAALGGRKIAAPPKVLGSALRTYPGTAAAVLRGRKIAAPPKVPGSALRPIFAASDARAEEILAAYPDGSAAVALRKQADGWSLFVGPPGLTSALLRLAARRAGVHLFTEVDCNVYANGPFVALHASQDGPVDLDLGRAGPVRDLLTGRALGQGPRLQLQLKPGETRVLATSD